MKHAYLIMAHNNFYILEKLIKMLDDSRNDIFVHIDKKVENFDFDYFSSLVKYSNVIFTPKRIKVIWGTRSQVKTEINLFETAYKYNSDEYEYYHLISGVDLPIKSQNYIHNFFNDKKGSFIFYKENLSNFERQRICIYHMFSSNRTLSRKINSIQIKMRINRMQNCKYELKKGYNWASLNKEAVKLILKNKKDIYKFTVFSLCADEMYKQMILYHYNGDVYKNIQGQTCDMRLVDWKRGTPNHPYVFKEEDFDEIIKSDMLFARKFDEKIDKEIVDKIYEYIMEPERRNI